MGQIYKKIFFLMTFVVCNIQFLSSYSCAPMGGQSALHEAVFAEDIKKVTKALNKGIPVDIRNNGLSTPLHWAARTNNYDIIKLLLQHKANVNAQDWYGWTALYKILRDYSNIHSKEMRYKVAVLLLEYGADLTLRDYNGYTPLDRAANDVNNHQFLTLLLKRGVCLADVNYILLDAVINYCETKEQLTLDLIRLLVQQGCEIGDLSAIYTFLSFLKDVTSRDAFQMLCEQGIVDINLRMQRGFSLLHLAVMDESYDIITFLLENGARGDIKDRDGLSPLYYAATEQMYNFLRAFPQILVTDDNDTFEKHIAYKNKPEISVNEEGQTLLHQAILKDNWYEINRLIQAGANIHKHDTKDGYTPLHYAAHMNSVAVCQLLIDLGVDINCKNDKGLTPLHLANQNNEYIGDLYEVCELLIAAGADVNALDLDKQTPLHYAGYNNAFRVANLLIAAGANVHAQDRHGLTPLHCAACYKNPWILGGHDMTVAQILLEAGAHVNCKDYRGYSPLYCALFSKSNNNYDHLWFYEIEDIIYLLVNAGADVNSKDKHGFSLLHYAVNIDCIDRVDFLLRHNANSDLLDAHGEIAFDYAKSKERKKLFSQIKKNKNK